MHAYPKSLSPSKHTPTTGLRRNAAQLNTRSSTWEGTRCSCMNDSAAGRPASSAILSASSTNSADARSQRCSIGLVTSGCT